MELNEYDIFEYIESDHSLGTLVITLVHHLKGQPATTTYSMSEKRDLSLYTAIVRHPVCVDMRRVCLPRVSGQTSGKILLVSVPPYVFPSVAPSTLGCSVNKISILGLMAFVLLFHFNSIFSSRLMQIYLLSLLSAQSFRNGGGPEETNTSRPATIMASSWAAVKAASASASTDSTRVAPRDARPSTTNR